jgi:hypothetical protein
VSDWLYPDPGLAGLTVYVVPVKLMLTSAPVPIEVVVNAGPAKFPNESPPAPDVVNDVIAPAPSTPSILISKSFVGLAPPNTLPGILTTPPTEYPASVDPAFRVTGLYILLVNTTSHVAPVPPDPASGAKSV